VLVARVAGTVLRITEWFLPLLRQAYRWSMLSRRPDTPDTETPAWTMCVDWAVTAARQAA